MKGNQALNNHCSGSLAKYINNSHNHIICPTAPVTFGTQRQQHSGDFAPNFGSALASAPQQSFSNSVKLGGCNATPYPPFSIASRVEKSRHHQAQTIQQSLLQQQFYPQHGNVGIPNANINNDADMKNFLLYLQQNSSAFSVARQQEQQQQNIINQQEHQIRGAISPIQYQDLYQTYYNHFLALATQNINSISTGFPTAPTQTPANCVVPPVTARQQQFTDDPSCGDTSPRHGENGAVIHHPNICTPSPSPPPVCAPAIPTTMPNKPVKKRKGHLSTPQNPAVSLPKCKKIRLQEPPKQGVNLQGHQKTKRPSLQRQRASPSNSPYLRKGKWTREEEEYTRLIISHYKSGLLILPGNKSLRLYLASELNCDPMRITKKFGAFCPTEMDYMEVTKICERSFVQQTDMQNAKKQAERLHAKFLVSVGRMATSAIVKEVNVIGGDNKVYTEEETEAGNTFLSFLGAIHQGSTEA